MITHILKNAILSPVELFQPTGCLYVNAGDEVSFDGTYLKCITGDTAAAVPFYVATSLSELRKKIDIVNFSSSYQSLTGILEVPFWGRLVIFADPAAYSELKVAAFNSFFKSNPHADLKVIDKLYQCKSIYLNNVQSGYEKYYPGLDFPVKEPLDIPTQEYPLEMKMGLWLMDPSNASKEEDFKKDLQSWIDLRGASAISTEIRRLYAISVPLSEIPSIDKYPLLSKLKGLKGKSDDQIKQVYEDLFGNLDAITYYTHPRKTVKTSWLPPRKDTAKKIIAFELEMSQLFYENTPLAGKYTLDHLRLDQLTELFPTTGEDIFSWRDSSLFDYFVILAKFCSVNAGYMTYIWKNRKNRSVLEKCCPLS